VLRSQLMVAGLISKVVRHLARLRILLGVASNRVQLAHLNYEILVAENRLQTATLIEVSIHMVRRVTFRLGLR
jgi:hypothetical protein